MVMSRTRILLAVLVLVALLQLFPSRATLLELIWVAAMAIWCLAWAGSEYLAHRKSSLAEAAQAAADDAEYRQYKAALDAIRAEYDPERSSSDPTSIAPECRDALASLHEKHQAMLERKFGPR